MSIGKPTQSRSTADKSPADPRPTKVQIHNQFQFDDVLDVLGASWMSWMSWECCTSRGQLDGRSEWLAKVDCLDGRSGDVHTSPDPRPTASSAVFSLVVFRSRRIHVVSVRFSRIRMSWKGYVRRSFLFPEELFAS